MHFAIIFIAVSVVLYAAVTPVYEYFKRKQTIKQDEVIRKADAEERRIQDEIDSREQARKDSEDHRKAVDGSFDQIKTSHGVEYPWTNLKNSEFKPDLEIRGAVDKAFKKRMFMDTGAQKTQFKEATKKLMEDE